MTGKEKNGKKGNSVQSRIGIKFYKAIEEIKDARLRNGKSRDRLATEKITNMIVRHKEAWKVISNDLINADEEEINKFGNG